MKIGPLTGFVTGSTVALGFAAWLSTEVPGKKLAGLDVAATWEWGKSCHEGDYLFKVVVPEVLVKEGEVFRGDDTAVEALYCYRDKVNPGESRAYFVRICRQGADCTGDPAREPDAKKLSNNP